MKQLVEQDPSIKITNSTLRPFNFSTSADTSLSGICCGCLGSVRRRKWPMAAEG
ncbi:hypothetical protein [Klebsiella michiganensis]|uniref:hypothetical protein n=1 Tax=Klebsiella michiganensis TaxID=1134687 RepID=UPI00388E1CB0